MALVQKTKYIVWNDDFKNLKFMEAGDPLIDDYDYALPLVYEENDKARGAERLPSITVKIKNRAVTTTI